MSSGEGNVCASHPTSRDPNPAVRGFGSRGMVCEGRVKFFFVFFLAMTLLGREASVEQEVEDPPIIERTLMLLQSIDS
jgi:hypothetical protein